MSSEGDSDLLLTGASGFVGSVVQHHLRCAPLTLNGKIVDLKDAASVTEAVAALRPNAVLHLAAQTFVPRSFADPLETYEINFLGTFNLLSALKTGGFRGKMVFVSSGDVYGTVKPELLPINESTPPRPKNPYAVSKVAAEALCIQWSQTENFKISIARPFNHIGPGQRPEFVLSGFAKQIVEIRRELKPPVIEVGDIDVTRDFTDVRDVVRAYEMLLHRGGNAEVYNVCSGVERSIRALLEKMMAMAGVSAEIKTESGRLRPADQKRVYGSFQKIRSDIGWEPSIAIEQSLREILEYWEKEIA